MLASDAFVAKCAALFCSLYMCEEDGNVDWDFPALDPVLTKSKNHAFFLSVHRNCLKGHCHETNIFFEGLNIFFSTHTFCVYADGFQDLSKVFQYPIQLLTFYLLLWNYLLIWIPYLIKKPPQNSLLCDWPMFSSANLSLAAGKIHKN